MTLVGSDLVDNLYMGMGFFYCWERLIIQIIAAYLRSLRLFCHVFIV